MQFMSAITKAFCPYLSRERIFILLGAKYYFPLKTSATLEKKVSPTDHPRHTASSLGLIALKSLKVTAGLIWMD